MGTRTGDWERAQADRNAEMPGHSHSVHVAVAACPAAVILQTGTEQDPILPLCDRAAEGSARDLVALAEAKVCRRRLSGCTDVTVADHTRICR